MKEAVISNGVEQARETVGHMKVQQTKEATGRIIVQQCRSATLEVEAAEGVAPYKVEIGRGMVVYVCFLKNATEKTVDKLTKHIANARVFKNEAGRFRLSVCEVQGDVLIVPQSTIGGKPKGKSMRYHFNIENLREELYITSFVNK